jgi:6-pyruvoyltetrahydropterin/6-carboxytetrahydropterin synthase
MPYRSTKTFGHDLGLSACFRQWRADSHCRFLHGYALAVHLEFEAKELDERGWVVDFGALKSLRAWLQDTFDHLTLVAEDDPQLAWFLDATKRGMAQVRVVRGTGCERFAEMVFDHTQQWLLTNGYAPRVRLVRAEVKEHGANGAMVTSTS